MTPQHHTEPLSDDGWTLLVERYDESDEIEDDAREAFVEHVYARPLANIVPLCRSVARLGLVGWYRTTPEYQTALEDIANGDREVPT